jgi:hypothetical protein
MIRQFGVPTTIDDIIETTIIQLAKHQLLNGGPNISYPDINGGKPIIVKKYRNFNGIELKEPGLTLSVYPFNYEGTSRPTPESTNTSISFKPYGLLGSDPTKPRNGIDLAVANIKVRLDYLSYSLREKSQNSTIVGDPFTNFGSINVPQVFETNDVESMLRKYVEYVRLVLSTDLFNLGGWIKSSFVTWCNFPTTTWDAGGSMILHTAELMWQVSYYPLREWRVDQGVRGLDPIIGTQSDGSPVFYLSKHDLLVNGYGVALFTTPTGLPITWDKNTNKLINSQNKEVLSNEALVDARNQKPFVDLNILPIGVLKNGDITVYYNVESGKITKYDGTEINKIPGPLAKLTGNKSLDMSDTSKWINIAWNKDKSKLVYGDGHELKGEFVKASDLVDPSSGDLYIITQHTFSVGTSAIREFAMF